MTRGFSQTDRDRLTRLEMKLDAVVATMQVAASDEGFPRCQVRKEKWDKVEEHIESVEKATFWLITIIIGTVLTTGIAYAIGPIIHFISDGVP